MNSRAHRDVEDALERRFVILPPPFCQYSRLNAALEQTHKFEFCFEINRIN